MIHTDPPDIPDLDEPDDDTEPVDLDELDELEYEDTGELRIDADDQADNDE